MPLFNYLTHHLGSFGSIYDSTLINGFASRMGRAAYGDLIVEIPINHGGLSIVPKQQFAGRRLSTS